MGITKGTVFNPGVAQVTGQGGASGDALLKSQNGADISDTARFRHNIGVDGMTLSGPRTVYPGVTHEFNLTGWSDFSIYQISADAGTVDVKDGVIVLHVPVDVTGNVTLTVTRNDAHYSFTLAVSPVFILPPQITSPADGATDIDFTPVLTASGFACNQEGVDTYLKTQWEISVGPGYYTDEELATAVFEGHPRQEYNVVALRDSAEEKLDFAIPLSFGPEGEFINDVVKKSMESYTYTPAETRDYLVRRGATYRVRARHVGHMLVGGWSEYATLTISDHPIAKPVITYPAAGETDVDASPVLAASDFSLQHNAQDELSTSEWEIATDPAFADVVWKGSESSSTASPPGNIFRRSSTYYLRMRYKGKVTGCSDYSDTVSFTTAAHFLPTKVVAMLLPPGNYPDAYNARFNTPAFSHDNTWLFVGAPGAAGGTVYAFKRDGQTWKLAQTIKSEKSNDGFGGSIIFAAGALFVSSGLGVYEYRLEGEQFVGHIVYEGYSPWELGSGLCVTQDGNTVVIVMSTYPSNTVKVLNRKGDVWSGVEIHSPDSRLSFGADLSISDDGTVLAIGAQDGQGRFPGKVYIYRLTERLWKLEQTLQKNETRYSQFGMDIGLSRDGTVLFAGDLSNNEGILYSWRLENGEWKDVDRVELPKRADVTFNYTSDVFICRMLTLDQTGIVVNYYCVNNGRLKLKSTTTVPIHNRGTIWMRVKGQVALSDDKTVLALGIPDDTVGQSSNAVVILTEGGVAE
ncbi:hypothetical protein NI479_003886 [Salmonella enterica]|nr:hypothetical protein [Salmonella enterica]EJJ4346716.1 hypothetical protein [Salmonella enterica]